MTEGALVFAYAVKDPQRYRVVEIGANGRTLSLEEKPARPRSNWAVPGLYFHDTQVVGIAERLQPPSRGEIEMTDVNKDYMARGQLWVSAIGRGVAWPDAGTHTLLLQASAYVQVVEERQAMMISCPEEIAYRMGYIGREELRHVGQIMPNNE